MVLRAAEAYPRSMSARSSAVFAAHSRLRGSALGEVLGARDELKAGLAPLGATNLAVFGSVARGEEREDSDVDLLVDLDVNVGLFAMLRMRGVAEQILGRPVDIVPRSGLKDDLVAVVRREAIAL